MGGCLTKQTIIEPIITDNKPKIKIQFIDSSHNKKIKKRLILNKKLPIIHIKAINKISLRKKRKINKRPPFKYYV